MGKIIPMPSVCSGDNMREYLRNSWYGASTARNGGWTTDPFKEDCKEQFWGQIFIHIFGFFLWSALPSSLLSLCLPLWARILLQMPNSPCATETPQNSPTICLKPGCVPWRGEGRGRIPIQQCGIYARNIRGRKSWLHELIVWRSPMATAHTSCVWLLTKVGGGAGW